MAAAERPEIIFVVDVSSLTKKGFVGTSTYGGKKVDLEFDDSGAGVFLTSDMAGKLHVRKGSKISIIVEDEKKQIVESTVGGVGSKIRISDPKVYYAVGREGGAVIRLLKG